MSEEQVQAIELSIEQAKESISTSDALFKLINNSKEFKDIITVGYFEKEASRLVLLKAAPEMQDADSQRAIEKSIDAIGHLRQYFVMISQFGAMAKRALADDQDTLDELLNED